MGRWPSLLGSYSSSVLVDAVSIVDTLLLLVLDFLPLSRSMLASDGGEGWISFAFSLSELMVPMAV